jgi:oxygen-independent coproporphyrinogen-3 oxidase
LIYGFNELTTKDILNTINFIKSQPITHVSWYALEVKEGSILSKQNYYLSDEHIDQQLGLIIKHMRNINYDRYEVSSWSKHPQYESQHNKAYWLTQDWSAIGLGAFGFENRNYYSYVGTIDNYKKQSTKYSLNDYYFQIMLMGLRLKQGLNLSNHIYNDAYQYFKDKLKDVRIVNHHLVANNLNLIDNILIELI